LAWVNLYNLLQLYNMTDPGKFLAFLL